MYYCRTITRQAWMVPSILAEFPKTPSDTSSNSEKGYFALFMLLLFHPWRHLQTDLFAPAFAHVSHPFDPWLALHGYFDTWYKKQEALEAQVKQQYAEQGLAVAQDDLVSNQDTEQTLLASDGSVPWQSAPYWAARCMPVMRTMRQSFRRHKDTSGSVPTHWMPPGGAEVELTDESASEAETVLEFAMISKMTLSHFEVQRTLPIILVARSWGQQLLFLKC